MNNQLPKAQQAWEILTACAKEKKTIQYGQIATLLGMHPRPVRFVLSPIQDYCREQQLPPLTILVVNKRGRPGSGFIARDPDHFNEGLEEVYVHKWQDETNPFAFAGQIANYDAFLKNLLNSPAATADDAYAKVKVRGVAQLVFRDLCLKAYRRRCAFSDCGLTDTLEAVHIVPWSSCDKATRLDVRNGILLTSIHHKLFDHGILTIAPDYRIVYCPPKHALKTPNAFDQLLTTGLHLKPMRLPGNPLHHPDPEFIKQHNQLLDLNLDTIPPLTPIAPVSGRNSLPIPTVLIS